MQTTTTDGLIVVFNPEEREAAELVRQACEKAARLMREHWSLSPPADCRVYIMTSWSGFVFQSAPWPWRVLLAVTLPLWVSRVRQTWALAGGWQQSYGRRQAVGVKPPRLLEHADRSLGDRVFVRERDLSEKVQSVACHELAHAFSAHLRLPTWLKEGFAMLAVDRFFGTPTVRSETLEALERPPAASGSGGQTRLRLQDEAAVIRLYARGYWLTRYLDETRPELLKELLSQRFQQRQLEARVAAACGSSPAEFWQGADALLLRHFRPARPADDEGILP